MVSQSNKSHCITKIVWVNPLMTSHMVSTEGKLKVERTKEVSKSYPKRDKNV